MSQLYRLRLFTSTQLSFRKEHKLSLLLLMPVQLASLLPLMGSYLLFLSLPTARHVSISPFYTTFAFRSLEGLKVGTNLDGT